MRWRGMWVLTVALSLAACGERPPTAGADASPRSQADAHYRMAVEQRRAQRVARLRAPGGWLSYTGSGACTAACTR
ncbi:hypothetical protein XTG29_02365 [Xanthomonas translucens pv. graminis ART-Xtg29]|nr:hypothetical protein XTG29_02365 [Xanthomonas translucens pv. graminis ART-Xtg29]